MIKFRRSLRRRLLLHTVYDQNSGGVREEGYVYAHIQVVSEGFGSISNALGLLGVVLPLDCISVESHVPDCLYGRTHTVQWNTGVCMCGEGRGGAQS